MKILTVSDEECAALWDNYVPGRLKEYDLILSCGDDMTIKLWNWEQDWKLVRVAFCDAIHA